MSMTTSHPLLVAGLTSALRQVTGRLLMLAPDGQALLARLRGQVIALEVRPFRQRLYLCPAEREIQVLTEISGEPDVLIQGSPSALVRMGLGGALEQTLVAGEIEISGDSATARRFQALLKQLDLDAAAWLGLLTRSPWLGAALAGPLRGSGDWSRSTVKALQDDVSEYLREEVRWLPADTETDRFLSAVDDVRAQSDRLQARMSRLNAALIPPASTATP